MQFTIFCAYSFDVDILTDISRYMGADFAFFGRNVSCVRRSPRNVSKNVILFEKIEGEIKDVQTYINT